MRSMTVFNYLLEATLFGSVLILLLVAARALLRDRLGSRVLYACWALAALRLLTPLSLPNPVMDEFRPGLSADVGARPVADQVRQRVIDAGYRLSQWLPWEENPAAGFTSRLRQGLSGRWVLLLWIAVALCVGAFLWARYRRFKETVRRNRVRALQEDELELLRTLCQRYRIRRQIPVYFVDRLTTGCIAGVWQPFIALPLELPREHLALALSHQLCHWKARDPFWGMIRGVCCAVHWFNPVVWMGAWLSYCDSEMACDDRVTARLHDIDRLAYANVIVSAGEKEVAMSMGATVTSRHLRQRVTSVIRCVRGSRVGVALTSLAAALVLLVSFATGESEPLPTVNAVPAVAWTAAAVPITGDLEAIACARRFLESEFVGQDTSGCSFTARYNGTQWVISAQAQPHMRPILLRYSHDGYLLEYDGAAYLDRVSFADASYTHRTLTQSVTGYLNAFMNANVPGLRSGRIVADRDMRSGNVRLLDCRMLDDQGETVCLVDLQVEPVVRVVYCMPLFDEEANG